MDVEQKSNTSPITKKYGECTEEIIYILDSDGRFNQVDPCGQHEAHS